MTRPYRRLGAVLAALAVATSGAPSTAAVPQPVLRATGGAQPGAPWWVTDHSPAGRDLCLAMHADGTGAYPDPVGHRHDQPLPVRLGNTKAPVRVSVHLWRAGVADQTFGPPELPRYRLRPVRRGNQVVDWELLLDAPGVGDLHLDVYLRWPDTHCGDDEGTWRFRVRSLA